MFFHARIEVDGEGIMEKIAKVKEAEAALDSALYELNRLLEKCHAEEERDSEESLKN